MCKNLKNNNKLAEGNSIVFRFFAVITGFIPVILVQRVSYLVNKLAFLLKRSMLSQDCRNASGNDWCWRRGRSVFNTIALNVILRRERSELSGESRNKISLLLKETKCITPRLFSVIFGLVPKILVQRVTNLVNKVAILLHKYRFSQDCRNGLCVMSGNDRCWGCGYSVCYQFFKRMYHPGSSANELTLKAKDDYKSTLQCGRSMIEMLGVLAIIAVLSVGGIAGYGKAMRMWNSNLQKEQLTQLLQSLVRLRYDLSHDRQYNERQVNVSAILYALGEVPTGMRYNGNLWDKTGNGYIIQYGHGCWQTKKDSDEQTCSFSLGFTVTLVKTDSSLAPSSEDLCVNIVNVAKENADDVRGITTFLGNKDKNDEENWRGYIQTFEFSQSTLRTATPMQILQMCRKCKDQPYCRVNVSITPN